MHSSRFRTLNQVEQKLHKLGNLKLWRRVLNGADIEVRVQELKDILNEAYIKFDVSTRFIYFCGQFSVKCR